MNRLVPFAIAAAFAVGGHPTAQTTTVFPSDHTGTGGNLTLPGETYMWANPMSNGIQRQMIVYDAWDLRVPNGRSISRIGFVRDSGLTSTGQSVLLKVQMGQCTLPFGNISSVFAQNFTTTPTVVFGTAQGAAKVFALPNLGGVGGVDVVWLPLDTPFVYDSSKGLVVDFQVYTNNNGNNPFSYYLDAASHRSPQRDVGIACRTSGGLLPHLESSTASYLGGNWSLSLNNAPSTTPMALLVGIASHEPGIALDVIGMPGCMLSIDPLWSGASTSYSGGWYSWNFGLPNNRNLFGARLYAQVVMQDVFANSLGWITSNGDELQLGIPPQATLIYGNQGDPQPSNGWVQAEFGLITLFDHN